MKHSLTATRAIAIALLFATSPFAAASAGVLQSQTGQLTLVPTAVTVNPPVDGYSEVDVSVAFVNEQDASVPLVKVPGDPTRNDTTIGVDAVHFYPANVLYDENDSSNGWNGLVVPPGMVYCGAAGLFTDPYRNLSNTVMLVTFQSSIPQQTQPQTLTHGPYATSDLQSPRPRGDVCKEPGAAKLPPTTQPVDLGGANQDYWVEVNQTTFHDGYYRTSESEGAWIADTTVKNLDKFDRLDRYARFWIVLDTGLWVRGMVTKAGDNCDPTTMANDCQIEPGPSEAEAVEVAFPQPFGDVGKPVAFAFSFADLGKECCAPPPSVTGQDGGAVSISLLAGS